MDYEEFKIKAYDSWDLFLHMNQYPYIGRCYAWARRENAGKVNEMNPDEREELFGLVIPEWDNAVSELFGEHWPNVACFGNEAPHLHWHLIPRYSSSIVRYGVEFRDPNPGGNYSPYPKRRIEKRVLIQIKEDIQRKII
jgi:diadenosine tetraphosphate (Ap4A) HIT family hydrolase